MIVADASLLVTLLTDGGSNGQAARKAFSQSGAIYIPDVAYVEAVSLLRRLWLKGTLLADRCRAAMKDLDDLPLYSYPARPLLPRTFQLWADMTTQEACYVALAEALRCDLITGDRRLTAATGLRCRIRMIGQDISEVETES